ncbi:MAG: primosomal protein N' [Vampirovibrionales bacterium]|nr:primosomal protein N' [Vampirovibrionales bacterium]
MAIPSIPSSLPQAQLGLFGVAMVESSTPKANQSYVQVWVDVAGIPNLATSTDSNEGYTYSVPEHLTQSGPLQVGMAVSVGFGGRPHCVGIIVSCHTELPASVEGFNPSLAPNRIKPIEALLSDAPLFPAADLAVLKGIAEYTGSSLGSVIKAVLPAKLLQQAKPQLALCPEVVARSPRSGFHPTAQQVLAALDDGPLSPTGLQRKLTLADKPFKSLIQQLLQQGVIQRTLRWQNAAQAKTECWLVATKTEHTAKLPPKQHALLAWITDQGGEVLKAEALSQASRSVLQGLMDKGVVSLEERNGYGVFDARKTAPLHLTTQQQRVTETLWDAKVAIQINVTESLEPFCLMGVTGSGKTAVYLELAKRCLSQGQSVLILVPEIALTGALAHRLEAFFGPGQVIRWHSNLSDGERATAWHRIQTETASLVIGARSAVLLPLPNLGLIVLDEAHDASFKQETPAPRYHAQTVARLKAQQHCCLVVLGSATPDVSDWYRAVQANRLLTLDERYGQRPLATVQCVDLRMDNRSDTFQSPLASTEPEPEKPTAGSISSGAYGQGLSRDNIYEQAKPTPPQKPSASSASRKSVSPALIAAMQQRLEAGEQSLILINRRGFHTLVQCGTCQQTLQCPDCAVSLTVHRAVQNASNPADPDRYCCHHCGYMATSLTYCPHCASRALRKLGTGSQKVEDELHAAFPDARIARLDRDITQRKGASDTVLADFSAHRADILVGTQMVAKGLDIANVTLVGVLQADSSLMLPDYRSSERTFQLLTQVAGRSGRGDKPGEVLIQTYNPSHPVIQRAMDQDTVGFLHDELLIRQDVGFPPFTQLIRLILAGEQEGELRQTMEATLAHLKAHLVSVLGEKAKAISVLGPAPCLISRIQGLFRYHLLIKIPTTPIETQKAGHRAVVEFYQSLRLAARFRTVLDVDALSLY